MFYYSQAISKFHRQLQGLALGILQREMGLKCSWARFQYQKHSYPLNFISFESEKLLGYFDPKYLQIGIHRNLLFTQEENFLLDLLRHELIHYLAYIKYGEGIQPHGKEFRELCRSFNYGEKVYKASCQDGETPIILKSTHEKSQVLKKIKKLLNLTESANIHEANLALEKANELLEKHQLSTLSIEENFSADYRIKVLKEGKRISAKDQAIFEILTHFFVKPIFHQGQRCFRLEIFGQPLDVENAHYIFDFLNIEMESLWEKEKKKSGLKGLRNKNSFFFGFSQGFSQSILKRTKSKEIILLDKMLTESFSHCYQRKRQVPSEAKLHKKSQKLGQKRGSELSLRKPIKNRMKKYLLGRSY